VANRGLSLGVFCSALGFISGLASSFFSLWPLAISLAGGAIALGLRDQKFLATLFGLLLGLLYPHFCAPSPLKAERVKGTVEGLRECRGQVCFCPLRTKEGWVRVVLPRKKERVCEPGNVLAVEGRILPLSEREKGEKIREKLFAQHIELRGKQKTLRTAFWTFLQRTRQRMEKNLGAFLFGEKENFARGLLLGAKQDFSPSLKERGS